MIVTMTLRLHARGHVKNNAIGTLNRWALAVL